MMVTVMRAVMTVTVTVTVTVSEMCPSPSLPTDQLKFLYRMKMEIADHTGKMTVLLGDDNAVRSVLASGGCMHTRDT